MGRIIPFILILHIYALVDCLQTNHAEVPGRIPRALWAFLTLVPVIGPVVWLGVHWVGYQEAKARRREAGNSGPQLRGFPTLTARDLHDGGASDFPRSPLSANHPSAGSAGGFNLSGRIRASRSGPLAPDDNPEFLAELAAQQRRREARNSPSAPSAPSSSSAPTTPTTPTTPATPTSPGDPLRREDDDNRPGEFPHPDDGPDVDDLDDPEDPAPPLTPA